MRARIREPGESLRWFFVGLAAICILAAAIFRSEIGPPLDPVFFMGAALLLMSPIFQQRTAWRQGEIDAQPGRLLISRRGIFAKRETCLATRNVIGASVARVGERVNLALAVGPRSRHPVVIAFESETDAALATKALGIGGHGFGVVVWERGPRFVHRVAASVRVAASFYCFVVCVLAKVSDPFAATLDVQSVSTLIVVGALAFVLLVPLVIARRTTALNNSGVVNFEDRIQLLRWSTIASIQLENSQFVIDRVVRGNDARHELMTARIPFVKRSPFLPGLDDVDTALILDHVSAASERARLGMGPETHQQVRTLLAKKDRETNAEWIRRIDDLAESWRASPPRYGESVTYSHALWEAVEDHDCDENLRVLAARMLAKLDPEAAPPKLRVIAEAIRIPHQASRIRIALEPEVEALAKSIAPNSRR
ncbi:MAG: hypothetical protein ABI183_09665 [Polyangiaceae bacterium]